MDKNYEQEKEGKKQTNPQEAILIAVRKYWRLLAPVNSPQSTGGFQIPWWWGDFMNN